jgi:hypothetical protein
MHPEKTPSPDLTAEWMLAAQREETAAPPTLASTRMVISVLLTRALTFSTLMGPTAIEL